MPIRKDKINEICSEYNFIVNKDGTVDADAMVVMYNKKISEVPNNFGTTRE
jgi:hypothetical protein